MTKIAVLLATLVTALAAGLSPDPGAASPQGGDTGWVERRVAEVVPGQAYSLQGCLTITGAGVELAVLRALWYDTPDGHGSSIYRDDAQANTSLVGLEQCLTLSGLHAPCAARSVIYGVLVLGDTTAVTVSNLELSPDPSVEPVACPTPTPVAVPTSTATPSPQPAPKPPAPTPATPPAEVEEPPSFPALVNGGFEQLREDGTPYGWHKVGGELASSETERAEGRRAAALLSRTASTKWLYQAVAVRGGAYYRLSAKALKGDPAAREVFLRVSWYASADGSGSQLSTDDSEPLAGDAATFVSLDTGPVQAPPEARSARLRLLLRPASAAAATAYFDDVSFTETDRPDVVGASEGEAEPDGARAPSAGGPAQAPRPGAAALSVWVGPTPLANPREPSSASAPVAGGDGRPLWPLLLALAAPALGLPLLAAGARREVDRSR